MRNENLDLPVDEKKIIESLITKVEDKYRKNISLIICYGSQILGTPHEKSDLDFFFIPRNQKGYEMNFQFIIDGVGYDFWPLSWKRAEQIANFKENIVSIIADGLVVYYYNSSELERFNSLKQRIKDITNSKNNEILIDRAKKLLNEAKIKYFNMNYIDDSYENYNQNCYEILNLLVNALAFINSTYIKKAVYNIKEEIKTYSILPENFMKSFKSIIKSCKQKDKNKFIKDLITDIDRLIKKNKIKKDKKVKKEHLRGFYEEIKSSYNKLLHACNTKDYLKAFFTANTIDIETRAILGKIYDDYNFPDLISKLDSNNYEKLIKSTNRHEEVLVDLLKEHDISICEFDTVDDFVKSI